MQTPSTRSDSVSSRQVGSPPAEDLAHRLRASLIAGRNTDGGWGYYAGKSSRLEPTCWGILALSTEESPADRASVASAFPLLATWQRADGLLAEPGLPPNLAFNGLASVALTCCASSTQPAPVPAGLGKRLLDGISAVRSKKLSNESPPAGQDNSLVGWPWSEDTFAWVEPTAWCTLALETAREAGETPARVAEAVRVLRNRQCADGGWNYGNAEVLGRNLQSYVPPTALALLALQDRRREAWVKRALDFLVASWQREQSGMALGLSLLSFCTLGGPVAEVATGLAGAWQRSQFLGNHSIIGLAAYALATRSHGVPAFSV